MSSSNKSVTPTLKCCISSQLGTTSHFVVISGLNAVTPVSVEEIHVLEAFLQDELRELLTQKSQDRHSKNSVACRDVPLDEATDKEVGK